MRHVDLDLGPLWSIVLAGGQGRRLRRLVRRIHGAERPKQFAMITSERSLFRETLDRAALLTPRDRTAIIIRTDHARYLLEESAGRRMPHVLEQRADDGTSAAALLPARWVCARDPEAIVVIFPSDHLVVEGGRFMAHVAEVAEAVRANPDWVVLLGAQADRAEAGYQWIEPGRAVGRTSAGPISAVTHSWDRPKPAEAEACLAEGCLRNTFVLVAKAARVVELGNGRAPEPSARLAPLDLLLGPEPSALGHELMVSQMPSITWSDLDTPRRVFQLVRELDLRPPWLGARRVRHERRVSA